jgi:hypothetical protein
MILTGVKLFSAAVFFILWGIVGWTDYNHKKIRRQYLLYGAAAIGSAYAALAAATLLGHWNLLGVYLEWGYYQAALTNIFLCATAAAALWWFGIWPAGDAKLFMLVGAIYPLTNFNDSTDYRRLFLVVLINTFIPASLMVFLRAVQYVYQTRLSHRRHFLLQLGWQKEYDYLRDAIRSAARFGWERRGRPLEIARETAARPGAALKAAGFWLVNMFVMSLFSLYLRAFFNSPIVFTLFWGCVFLLWSRLTAVVRPGLLRALLVVAAAALLFFRPPEHWADLWRIFTNLSLFSFFFYIGIRWTMKVVAGGMESAYMMAFLLPVGAALLRMGASWLGRGLVSSSFPVLLLAGMGLFFGLSLVMVRLWDQEVTPSHIEKISSFIVLAPGFIERLKEDEEFFEEHFSRMYADGLTDSQARALHQWCLRNGVDRIPLTPTISFAAWIFLGFFLSWFLNGAHVLGRFI